MIDFENKDNLNDCDICGTSTYKDHKDIDGVKVLLCEVCYKVFKGKKVKRFREMLRNTDISLKFKCKKCGLEYTTNRKYREFIEGLSEDDHFCGVCK